MENLVQSAENILLQYRYCKSEIQIIVYEISELHKEPYVHIDVLRSLRDKLTVFSQSCMDVERRIQQLPPFEQKILLYRFGLRLCWKEIADELGCGLSQLHQLYQRALKLFSKQMC